MESKSSFVDIRISSGHTEINKHVSCRPLQIWTVEKQGHKILVVDDYELKKDNMLVVDYYLSITN
jgi:hypothetical protein